jgi:hypothetical protein
MLEGLDIQLGAFEIFPFVAGQEGSRRGDYPGLQFILNPIPDSLEIGIGSLISGDGRDIHIVQCSQVVKMENVRLDIICTQDQITKQPTV